MELDVGEQCTLETCKQLDFLPFTCDLCKKIFCKEHLKYEEHRCPLSHTKDRRAPECPLCSQIIGIKPNETLDQKVNEHIENDCKSDLAKHKRSSKCAAKGCKNRELVPMHCVTCKRQVCLRHRHENDHNCQGKQSIGLGNQQRSSASRQAGTSALSRNTQRSNLPRPQPATHKQTSQTTSRNPSLQHNMSEDEALAKAIQASLAESTMSNTGDLTEQEKRDLELAKALSQSEQQNSQRKDGNCTLS